MSRLCFKRPVGAGADVKELEYIIALHQTSKETRNNATVSSTDIVALLRSRYNLAITNEQAIHLVRSLGGGDTSADHLIALNEVNRPSNVELSGNGVVLHKAFGGVHSIFHKRKNPNVSEDHGMPGQEQPDDSDKESKPETMAGSLGSKASEFSSEPRRLSDLCTLNSVGMFDSVRMLAARDEVTALLREKVLEKTKSMRHLVTFPDDDLDDDVPIFNENEPVDVAKLRELYRGTHSSTANSSDSEDDNKGNVNAQVVGGMKPAPKLATVHENGVEEVTTNHDPAPRDVEEGSTLVVAKSAPADETNLGNSEEGRKREKKSVRFQDASDVVDNSRRQSDIFYDEDGEPLPEFLDLVQVLSTLLIPKLASICYEATNKMTLTEEDVVEPEDPAFADRLQQRFLSYGRNKLEIKEEVPPHWSAQEFLETGRKALLAAVAGDEDPFLDESLVQLLLVANGEIERANDEDLVREMVKVAQSASGRFDLESLVGAISSDLSNWDPTCQVTPTTFFNDVFGVSHPSNKTKLKKEEQPDSRLTGQDYGEAASTNKNDSVPKFDSAKRGKEDELTKSGVRREFLTAFLGIDLLTDGFASMFVQLLIWTTFEATAILYIALFLRTSVASNQKCAGSEYICMIVNSLYRWVMIACIMTATGLVFIIPVSVGNSPADQSAKKQIFACFAVLVNTVVPFAVVEWLRGHNYGLNEGVSKSVDDEQNETLRILAVVMGLAVALAFAVQGLVLLFVNCENLHKALRPFLFCGAAASFQAEKRVYCAAKFKIGKILSNALSLHKSRELNLLSESMHNAPLATRMALAGTRDGISRNFVAHGETYEEVGGVFWTFFKLFDGSLLRQEGIWLNSRLLLIQVNQVVIGIVLMVFFQLATLRLAKLVESNRAEIELTFTDDPESAELVLGFMPTGTMIRQSLIPASYVAMVVMICTILIYIPSSVSTVLSYRGQVRPSLGSVYFQRFRQGVDLVYMNSTNAIYGFAGAAVLFFALFGTLIFLCVWPISRPVVIYASAWVSGLAITMLLKVVITTACRNAQYRAYYRLRPAVARVTSVALESWFLGLGLSVFIARITQFILSFVFWIGRIDVPYLSEDVMLFGYGFDKVPIHFVKDLLVHEAHRHPYIEQLTQMYLMQLRHGDRFVSDACTVWRQLLVVALMPWMCKYRIFHAERRVTAEYEARRQAETEQEERKSFARMSYRGMADIADGVTGTGNRVVHEVADVGEVLYGAGADVANEIGKLVVGKNQSWDGARSSDIAPSDGRAAEPNNPDALPLTVSDTEAGRGVPTVTDTSAFSEVERERSSDITRVDERADEPSNSDAIASIVSDREAERS